MVIGLGRNPYEEREPPEKEPPVVPTREEFWRAYHGEPYPPEVPPEEPTLPPIPPEGITYTVEDKEGNPLELHILEDFEYVGTERTLVSQDYVVYSGKQEIGKYSRETGEFVPEEPTWWDKTLGVGAQILQWGFYPFAVTGMALRKLFTRTEEEREAALARGKEPFSWEELKQSVKEKIPGGVEYAKFRELPIWEQLAWEAPAWAIIGLLGISAIKGRAAAQALPTALRVPVRAALAPVAGYEWAVGKTIEVTVGGTYRLVMSSVLRRNLHSWATSAGVTIPKATEDAFIKQAVRSLSPKFMAKEAVKTLFHPTKAGFTVTEAGARAAETAAVQAIRTSPLLLGLTKAVTPTVPPVVPAGIIPTAPPTVPEVLFRGREEVAIELGEVTAEIEGLTEYLATEPARKLINLIKTAGKRKGEIANLTIRQYKELTGKETVSPTMLTVDKKHVMWEYALDDAATELGYKSGEELRYAIEQTGEANTRLTALKSQKASLTSELEGIALPKLTLTQQIKQLYSELSTEVSATQAAIVGLKGAEAKVAKQTLGILQKELTNLTKVMEAKVVPPGLAKLRQTIMAWAKFKGLPQTQYRKLFRETTGKTSLRQMTKPQLTEVLAKIRVARPIRIKGKVVIKPDTEGKIQSLKRALIEDERLTEGYFTKIVEQLHLKAMGYESQYRFITESEGKSLIRAMNDEAEIGYIKQVVAWEKGLDKNPAVKNLVEEYQRRIAKEGKVYFQGKPADASVLKDMRFFTDDLQVRTGKAFYHIYFLMNRTHLDNRIMLTALKRRQVGSVPNFRKIIGSKASLNRINAYIAAKNKWLKIKSPTDITPDEIKLANELEEQLFELVPGYRYQRFLDFYKRYEGNIDKIAGGIPDAPKADIRTAVNTYESQGAGKLRAYLDTRIWGVIESGFEPHFVVNPRLAMQRLRTSFATGRFRARSGVEFYPADMNIVQRVDRYTQQILNFNLRPYVRKLEELYREAIPQLKRPGKVRGALSMSANEMMGYVERGGALYNYIIKFAGQAYATVFGTMPILPFRNLFQNLAFHPDKSALIDPRNRKLTTEDWEFYHTNVTQMEAIPRDLLLAEEGGLPLPIINRMNKLIYRINIYGASDSKVNRVWSFWASLNKAERALKAYRVDGNVQKFISNSGMAEMTLTQQTDVLKLLTIDETRAIREIALEITNNVHFLYDRAQRAYIEMGGMGRVFGSLMIFPRSLVQRVIYQFKPLDPVSWAPPAKKRRALKVLIAMLVGSVAANYLFEMSTGRTDAPYNPLNILRWSPGGLAIGSVTAITDVIGDVFMALSGDENAKQRLPGSIERAGDTMIPYYKIIMTNLESALDLKYIDRLAYRELRAIIDKKLWEMGFLNKKAEDLYEPNKEFYEAERSWEWKIKHAIFGTEPLPPDPIVGAVENITEAQKQLGNFVLAEDSDDGYVYETGDLGAGIRKATSNLMPGDITEENGFPQIALMYKRAETFWDTHYYSLPASERIDFREQPTAISAWTEAYLFVWGKLSVLRNENSLLMVQKIMDDYSIPTDAISGAEKYPELRGRKAEPSRLLTDIISDFRSAEEDKKFTLLGQAVWQHGQLAVKNNLTTDEIAEYNWDIRSFDWARYGVLPHFIHWGNEFYKVFQWLSIAEPKQINRIKRRVPELGSIVIKQLLPIYQTESVDEFPTKTWQALLQLAVDRYGADELKRLVEAIGIPNQWDRIQGEINQMGVRGGPRPREEGLGLNPYE